MGALLIGFGWTLSKSLSCDPPKWLISLAPKLFTWIPPCASVLFCSPCSTSVPSILVAVGIVKSGCPELSTRMSFVVIKSCWLGTLLTTTSPSSPVGFSGPVLSRVAASGFEAGRDFGVAGWAIQIIATSSDDALTLVSWCDGGVRLLSRLDECGKLLTCDPSGPKLLFWIFPNELVANETSSGFFIVSMVRDLAKLLAWIPPPKLLIWPACARKSLTWTWPVLLLIVCLIQLAGSM